MSTSAIPIRRAAAAALAAVAVLAAVALSATGAHAGPAGTVLGAEAENAVEGEYIVVMEDGFSAMSSEYDAEVVDRFELINGFLAEMSADEAARVAADGSVAYVEQNRTVSVDGVQPGPPSWGLDRVDQLDRPLDNAYEYLGDGSGVTAYIIDTGINMAHAEFAGRIGHGADFVDGDSYPIDCHGHGTHVAGTVGGSSYGLAKKVTLVGVRVLNCAGSGTYASVLDGIQWVARTASGPSVANMSLGGGYSAAINQAVEAAVASGVTFAIAAGNSSQDACTVSPASAPSAITVAATGRSDWRAPFSNYGPCVDVFAPGVDITSAWIGSAYASNTISGTSMASPHVAGAAAVYLSLHPNASTDQVAGWVTGNAARGRVSDVHGSPNLLLYTGDDNTPGPVDCTGSNGTSTPIPDQGTVESRVSIYCDRAASASSELAVGITHSYRGDLEIYLIAPDGTSYQVKEHDIGDPGDNVRRAFHVDLSGEHGSGTWTLRVVDAFSLDSGTLDGWSLVV
ncbi:S8 family serine peptidase [Glycomyces arizonensis]|uniref:S8 family serine peptidase n=1 Tax=Glycomyces arizonensis TaxID=256035 RepID=UPI00040C9797|nr:S8 family serine peptidase [Glycomyces arizonensis]